MTFNPEGFADMKDKYFLLNGRGYPDTVGVASGSVPGWTGGINSGLGGAAATAGNPDIFAATGISSTAFQCHRDRRLRWTDAFFAADIDFNHSETG